MTQFQVNAEMMSAMPALNQTVEFRDAAGRLLGYFHPTSPAGTTATVNSPTTIPAIAPALVTQRRAAKLANKLGKSCVTML